MNSGLRTFSIVFFHSLVQDPGRVQFCFLWSYFCSFGICIVFLWGRQMNPEIATRRVQLQDPKSKIQTQKKQNIAQ